MIAFFKKSFRRIYILLLFPKGITHFLLDSLSYLFKTTHILGLPVNATIELTNFCDQNCPVCETGSGLLKRQKGSIQFEDYKKIIDKMAPFTNTVLLYYMGEPFLNKDIYEIISYTKSKRIFIKICTNGQNVDAERVIQSGLDEIQFQISGVTQQTHSKYRVNGDLSKILKNVRTLTSLKKKKIKEGKKIKTNIYLGLILMRHNEHELSDFFDLAKELDIDGTRLEAPCVRTTGQGELFLPDDKNYWLYDNKAFDRGILRHKKYKPNHCRWMFYSITITWEGDVIPCCRDVEGEYRMGNLLKDDIKTIWNGEKFKRFRKSVLKGSRPMPMCLLCDGLSFPSLEKV